MQEHESFADAVMAEGDLLGPDSPYVNNVERHFHLMAQQRHDAKRRDWRGNVDLLLLLPQTVLVIDRFGKHQHIQALIITEYMDGTVGMWRVRNREDALSFWRHVDEFEP